MLTVQEERGGRRWYTSPPDHQHHHRKSRWFLGRPINLHNPIRRRFLLHPNPKMSALHVVKSNSPRRFHQKLPHIFNLQNPRSIKLLIVLRWLRFPRPLYCIRAMGYHTISALTGSRSRMLISARIPGLVPPNFSP